MEEETKTIYISPSPRVFPFIITFLAIIGIFLMGELSYQFKSLPQNIPHEVFVTGEGRAYGKPDVAIVNFGVHTQDLKSQDAVSQNNKIMDTAIKAIKESGVKDEDIQTTLYNLVPQYDYANNQPAPLNYPPYPGKRTFRGYSLDQQIRVKIRNFDKINEILDKATAAGVNTVGELQFTVDDMEKIKSEARSKAIKQAGEKAKSLLGQAGLRSFELVNVSEGYGPGPIPYQAFDKGIMAVPIGVTPPSIQPGQLEVNSTVTLTYRIR